jgi:iron complex outermembrane receptor protein
MQYRGVAYTTSGLRDDQSTYDINDAFHFFNPKAGVTYLLGEGKGASTLVYGSYAISNREPTRSDYLEGTSKPRSERLYNLEIGARRKSQRHMLDVNYFLMEYKDQLVQTGALDNAGYPIRANVGRSFRTGVEVNGLWQLSKTWTWNANFTWSLNQNRDYVVFENNQPVTRNTTIILSPPVVAGSQLAWKPLPGLEAAWLSKYVGKQNLDNAETAGVSLSDYWINDLRFTYEIFPTGIRGITISLLINNVFDVLYASNGYSYAGVPYYYPQAGRNFMAMMTVRL